MCTAMLTRIFTFILLLAVLIFAGCSKNTSNSTIDDKVVKSSLPRDMAPVVSESDLAAAAAGNTEFALRALPLLETNPDVNVVFSPYSITQAAALVAAGANGTTLSGIETAMSFTPAQSVLFPAFNKLDLILASKTTGTVHSDGSQSPQLNIVNAVWAQDGFPLLSTYLDTLAINFGAGLHLVDYIHKTEEARNTINSWVNTQTNSRIPELLGQGTLNDLTRVVLTNAIWFKANWSSKFIVQNTATRTFFNRDATEASISFMNQTSGVPAVQNNDYQAVDIPYVDGNLSMLVVMPAAGTFETFLDELTPAKVNTIVGQLTHRQVNLSLPKFSFNTAIDLKSVLTAMGMTDAFDAAKADFSGMDGSRDLYLQAAVHKAFISVDENGTEAAAATAMVGGGSGYPSDPIIVNVDHPFIFMIRDRQTGLILFIGKIVKL